MNVTDPLSRSAAYLQAAQRATRSVEKVSVRTPARFGVRRAFIALGFGTAVTVIIGFL